MSFHYSNCHQRLFNPRHDAFFAEDLQQVVEAGAGDFAGQGQTAGTHQHAGFHAQRFGGFLERGFQALGVERGAWAKASRSTGGMLGICFSHPRARMVTGPGSVGVLKNFQKIFQDVHNLLHNLLHNPKPGTVSWSDYSAGKVSMGAISFSIDKKLLLFFRQRLQITTFVETGTYQGDSLNVAAEFFPECHSIEMSQELYEAAKKQFADHSNITLHQGESASILEANSKRFAERPVVFWLDAHWCVGENTAGQDSQSPLREELRAIKKLHPQSVVLIDDARLYLCPPPEPHRFADWPDFHDLVILLQSIGHHHRLMVLNDVIVFYPESIQADMALFARQLGVDWLILANNSRQLELQQLSDQAATQQKHKSLLRRLGLRKK